MSRYSKIDEEKIRDLLFGDQKYIAEFAQAGIDSFREYGDQYRHNLMALNEKPFRKAGHKIKPVSQMMGLDSVVEEYEHAKALLIQGKPEKQRKKSADRTEALIERIIGDLEKLKQHYTSE